MHVIHTGQQVLVYTCGVIMRGTVQQIQPAPWGDPFKIDLLTLQMALDYLEVDAVESTTEKLVHNGAV